MYIATGGSFHSWKFLPVIGNYVSDMLDGTLPQEFVERWHWDRPLSSNSANPTYQIVGDLQEIIAGRMNPKATAEAGRDPIEPTTNGLENELFRSN